MAPEPSDNSGFIEHLLQEIVASPQFAQWRERLVACDMSEQRARTLEIREAIGALEAVASLPRKAREQLLGRIIGELKSQMTAGSY